MILDYAKNRMILLLGGSIAEYPTFFTIGSGSGTVVSTQNTLFNPTDIQAITSSSYPSSQSLQFTGDWTSVEMSGTQLREFGICRSGTAFGGSMWSKVNFPAITFDGTNELRVTETWRVY